MVKSFLEAKTDFDNNYGMSLMLERSIVPVDGKYIEHISLKNKKGDKNEEYYKWQFIYSLIHSGLYSKDCLNAETYFPKGNKNSAPIKLDCAIFNDPSWCDWYQKWRTDKNQEALDWLREHLIFVTEFKKEESRNTETVFNVQLKPALNESEVDLCLGAIYDTERLYLFQRKKGKVLRLDESYNQKAEKSSTRDLSLRMTDSYIKIPSFEQLKKYVQYVEIDRTKRTIDNLDIISGVYSKQLKDGISEIVRVMDKVSMKNQRGYEILIQIIALKIFDEKRSLNSSPHKYLDFYKTQEESQKLNLLFYITKEERNFVSLDDSHIQAFINRIRQLYNDASQFYQNILKRDDRETIVWEKRQHIQVLTEVVQQFQDYSFVKSHKTDLYQIVFSKFANEFSKAEKGQFVTPIPLIDFLVQIVNPRSTESVIDPTVGIADFLSIAYVNSQGKLDDKNIYGVDNDEQMIMLAQLNMLLNGDGEANLRFKSDTGTLTWKFDNIGNLVELKPNIHKRGNWDNWKDQTKLKKFDVVLTNPPFGEDRKWEPKTIQEKEQAELYELWYEARTGDWIDLGLVFLENAYRILKQNGRLGIVLSRSIASIDRWELARKWLINKMRIVALFDLPANVFADTGLKPTLIVAYKPSPKELLKLNSEGYSVFIKDIHNVGYEVRTSNRVKHFKPIYKINEVNFDVIQDCEGTSLLDEEFTDTVREFREWCLEQEGTLQDLFIREK